MYDFEFPYLKRKKTGTLIVSLYGNPEYKKSNNKSTSNYELMIFKFRPLHVL